MGSEDGQHERVALTVETLAENGGGELKRRLDITIDVVLFVSLRADAGVPITTAG